MRIRKILQWVMLLSGCTTVLNIITINFYPLILPMANLSIIKLTFIAFAEKKYGYILISLLLNILILIGVKLIKRNRILFPVLIFPIFLGDFIHVMYLFINGLMVDFINTVIIWSGIIDIIVIPLFILYFKNQVKSTKHYKQPT